MARALILSARRQEISVSLQKIDRDRLYGTVEIEALTKRVILRQ